MWDQLGAAGTSVAEDRGVWWHGNRARGGALSALGWPRCGPATKFRRGQGEPMDPTRIFAAVLLGPALRVGRAVRVRLDVLSALLEPASGLALAGRSVLRR